MYINTLIYLYSEYFTEYKTLCLPNVKVRHFR